MWVLLKNGLLSLYGVYDVPSSLSPTDGGSVCLGANDFLLDWGRSFSWYSGPSFLSLRLCLFPSRFEEFFKIAFADC